MAITTAKELLELLGESQMLDAEQLRQARAAIRSGDNAGALAARLVEAGLLTEQQATQLIAGQTDSGQPWAKPLPPKRKAKPPAPPQRAKALPIRADEDDSRGEEAAAHTPKFLETPQQKIVAGAAALMGVAVLILLAILITRMIRSPDSTTAEEYPGWISIGRPEGGQPAGAGETPPLPGETSSLVPGLEADSGFMGIEFGPWYTTGPLDANGYTDAFFPEKGVDIEAKDPDGKPLWQEFPDPFAGIPQDLPQHGKVTTYLFRTITAKKPTTLHAGFSSDDTLDVWINGKRILAVNAYRPVGADTERANLHLNVGENELLMKIYTSGGGHAFFFDPHLSEARDTAPGEENVAVKPPAAETPPAGQPAVAEHSTPTEPSEPKSAKPKPTEGEDPPAKRPLSTAGNLATLGLDERSGKLFDLSGKSHHGTARGNVTYNQPGKHGGAMGFDGSGGDVILKDSQKFDFSGDFTWTAWIKTQNDGSIIAYTTPDGDCRHGMKVLHVRDGKLALEVGWTGVVTSGNKVNDDQWHHVALSVKSNVNGDRDRAVLYIDGKADGQKDDWKVDQHAEGDDFVLKIGRCNKNFRWNKFNGSIDGVTVWSRTLEDDEIPATADAQANPFQSLGQTGNLEPYGKTAMPPEFHSLGKLSLNPDADVNLFLVGGRQAVQLPRYLQIEQTEDEKLWLIQLCSPARGGKPVKNPVARIVLREQKLLFQWAKGVPSAKANALLNCGLDVSVDGRTFFLPLGRPVVVKPVVVNITTGTARSILPGDSLPLRESLRLQVVRVEGFPEPRFSPGDTLAPSEATDISFDPETFPKLWLHLAFDVKMRPTVEVTTRIDYEMENMTFRTFKLGEAEQLMNVHQMEQRRLFMEMRKVPLHDQNKINDYKNKIKKIQEEKIAKLLRLGEICKKLKEKPGKVHFRVYTVIDEDHELPLMQSFPIEGAEADK